MPWKRKRNYMFRLFVRDSNSVELDLEQGWCFLIFSSKQYAQIDNKMLRLIMHECHLEVIEAAYIHRITEIKAIATYAFIRFIKDGVNFLTFHGHVISKKTGVPCLAKRSYIFRRVQALFVQALLRSSGRRCQAGLDPGTLDEGQAGSEAGSDPGTLDEGQAGSDPGTRDEGQAGPNPDDINIAESLPLPTPSVLAGPNLEHSDVEITDPSSQPQPEHMDEGFTASAYPDVHKNLKLTVDEQVIPEEPVSSTGTLSSLQHLAKDFSFGDQFLNDKPSEADNEKTTADTEAESMVSVTIQQDTSIIPPMTSPVIDLVSRPDSPNVHWPLPTTTITTAAPTTTTLPLPPQPQQGSSDSILIKRIGELKQHIVNLVQENQALEIRLTKQGSRINKLESVDVSKMIREQTVEFIDSQEIDRKINESVKEVVSLSVKQAMRAPLRARFKDLPTFDMKEILLQRMLEENYDKGHAEHRVAYEALQGSIHRDECEDFDDDKAQEETKKKVCFTQVNEARGAKDTLVMVAPSIPISAEENLGDPIDIKVDIIHPKPVVTVAFPAAAVVRTQAQHGEAIQGIHEHLLRVPIQEELTTLRFRVDIAKAENVSLRARIKTTEAIEKITRTRERQARIKIEQQLAAV
ncbi:hypothetical protein Tco_0420904 [Tanacetum coccineum]